MKKTELPKADDPGYQAPPAVGGGAGGYGTGKASGKGKGKGKGKGRGKRGKKED